MVTTKRPSLRHRRASRSRWLWLLLPALLLLGLGGVVALISHNPIWQQQAQRYFMIQDINITGRYETPQALVLESLQVKSGDTLFAYDVQAAQARLEALPWVHTSAVSRRWPRSLAVTLEERIPLALWQYKGKIQLIDRTGTVIKGAEIERFAELPFVVGAGAPQAAAEFLPLLHAETKIAPLVQSLSWIGDRRWNIRLVNGVVIKLPEDSASGALARLQALTTDPNWLNKAVSSIDLRLPDRVILQTPQTPNGLGQDT